MKNRILAALAALGVAVGLVVVAPTAAQAHAPIEYVADCPDTAVSQQLVIQTWSPDYISVTAWTDYPDGPGAIIKPIGTAGPGDNGQVFYMEILEFDVVKYTITSPGNTNYFYHVDCQY